MARDTKVDVYMPFFVGDYLADTTDLTCEEHGAYFLLLMDLWRRDGHIEFSPPRLARICRLSLSRWETVWASLGRFFEVADGILSQGRLCHELAIAYGKKKEASEAGRKGAAARWGGHSDRITTAMAEGMRTQSRNDSSSSPSSSPPDHTHSPRDPSAGATDPVPPPRAHSKPFPVGGMSFAFLSVYDRYPNKHDKFEAAAAWHEIAEAHPFGQEGLAADILAAFDAGMLKRHPYHGEPKFRPKLERVLRKRLWLEPASAPADEAPPTTRASPTKPWLESTNDAVLAASMRRETT